MRIGLITLFRDNYGSELQCYATKTFLKKHGCECDVLFIEEHGTEKVKSKIKSILNILYHSIRYRGFWRNRKQIKNSIQKNNHSMTAESKFGLDWFCESVLQPKGVEYRLINSKHFNGNYDFFISGSDQVWGGGYLVHPFMFLEFVDDKKKVALSPSFGVEKIKDFNYSHFKKSISKIPVLSAREESGVKIIQELTSRTVPRLADPIMLLSSEEWEDFSKKGMTMDEDYIFVHFLGAPNQTALKTISYLAQKHNLNTWCFANDYAEYSEVYNHVLKSGNPYDYVALIKNARFVCTDSFHTSHFSIIFNKSFFTFERIYGHNNKQSSRLQNLFSIYNCADRYITNDSCDITQLESVTPCFDVIKDKESLAISEYLLNAIETHQESFQPEVTLKSKENCTGCMACAGICPTDAITVSYSDFGYRIPTINSEKCINCKLCSKVCHYVTPNQFINTEKAFIAYNTDKNQRQISASGGVFSALAYSFINNGGLVAASELSFSHGIPDISHIIVDKAEQLENVLGSKYAESNCANIYSAAAEALKKKKSVLFCGTSCQVKALYSYLAIKNIEIDQLFTIDLICHGVPGFKLFSDYTKFLSKVNGGEFSDFSFRSKESGDIRYQISGNLTSDDKQKKITVPIEKSGYYDMFMHQDSYRDQCYHCEYASAEKPADITIGDYFEAREDYPGLFREGAVMHDSDYINCLLINSQKGQKLISEFGNKLFLYPVSRKRVQLSHSNLCKPSSYTHVRSKMKREYAENGISGVERKYKSIFRFRKLLSATKRSLGFIKKAKRR
ncbi:MAG: polysaccharide pyruvyl transferase family protein [Ruminococcus flavefaciens]|nr:polysaccharide pyruvyl transferase family protein [Ruminococcus flavefaciens]MCM1060890.1 polysaccharide pyruvyl transferase family protein [Eubacterium sp.]